MNGRPIDAAMKRIVIPKFEYSSISGRFGIAFSIARR